MVAMKKEDPTSAGEGSQGGFIAARRVAAHTRCDALDKSIPIRMANRQRRSEGGII